MFLVPINQIHSSCLRDSVHSSISMFHGCRLQFVRYTPSGMDGPPFLQFISYSTCCQWSHPTKRFYSGAGNVNGCLSLASGTSIARCPSRVSFSTDRWLDKWTESQYRGLPKRPQSVVDYRSSAVSSEEDDDGNVGSSSPGSTMDRIVEKLKRFGYVDDTSERRGGLPERGSVDDIFYVEEGMLPNSRGGFSSDSPLGIDLGPGNGAEARFPWEKKLVQEEDNRSLVKRRSKTSLAELTLPESELRRLRHWALRIKEKTRIGGSGVTQEIVDKIHEKWKTVEVVRLKCEGAPALNMKRMHEILERKTGGLVIWRSGTSMSLYRGVEYEVPMMHTEKKQAGNVQVMGSIPYGIGDKDSHCSKEAPHKRLEFDVQVQAGKLPETNYEAEVDKLLDGLGPRYTDWPGGDPLPVDADLLPGVISGYSTPFRILPYGVRSTLGNREMTALRRLARVLPPHFALGRSRQHQGLAAAMVKLWEKSSVAKIAFKRGVQLTTSERMAEDIKKLTGGTILSRNKDFIVFYRGKDFLSPEVTEALLERARLAKALQDEEEQARLRASASVVSSVEVVEQPGPAGTLGETLDADARWGKRLDDNDREKMLRAAEVARHADLVRKLEKKFYLAERKLTKAEKALSKVEVFLKPAVCQTDPESISDEERFMFRKLGLRMKAFLLLGRRGVFDGIVENMHLHWKYRELVKVIFKANHFSEVKNVALSLEAESGGVLVSVDKISKGYAIIVFRGKDYKRPEKLRPMNLLTKRKALARSIELQRHQAICNHISTLKKRIEKFKSELDHMESLKGRGDEELYAKLDSAYPTEDDESDADGEEAYLETYESGEEDDGIDSEALKDKRADELPAQFTLACSSNKEYLEDEAKEDYDETFDSGEDTDTDAWNLEGQ